MRPEDHALIALIEFGEYAGQMDAFMRESASIIRAKLNCTQEEAERVLKTLQDRRDVERYFTSGRELSAYENMPRARWYWRVRQEN